MRAMQVWQLGLHAMAGNGRRGWLYLKRRSAYPARHPHVYYTAPVLALIILLLLPVERRLRVAPYVSMRWIRQPARRAMMATTMAAASNEPSAQ